MAKKFSAADLAPSLKACAQNKDLHKGITLHSHILKESLLRKDPHLGSALVNMYAKCGKLSQARQVFNDLPLKDVISWNAIIAGYAQQRQGRDALDFFGQMQSHGLSPDGITLTCVLKACGSIGALGKGRQIHNEISSQGFLNNDIVLGGALVDMYAKCCALKEAQEVFDELPTRNIISWNALIAGYAEHGEGWKALNCFEWMQNEGFSPDSVTFVCALKACGSTGAVDKGKQIHDVVVHTDLLRESAVLGNVLVNMYASCGLFSEAERVISELPEQSAVSWNGLIAGYVKLEHYTEALKCFEWMQGLGFSPNAVTFTCILKACSSMGDIDKGTQIHKQIVNKGFLGKAIELDNALVDMYAKCGALAKANQVLVDLPLHDVCTYTAIISGCAQWGQGKEALEFLQRMQCKGLLPSGITFACTLKACGIVKATDAGMQIHHEIVSRGLLQKDITVSSALIDMYAKCSELALAQQVLDTLSVRNAVCWGALIAGYAEQGKGKEALNCFEWMQQEGISADVITLACVLKACGSVGAICKGKQIHDEITKHGFLRKGALLGNALVTMYAKCGALVKAEYVFNELPMQDVVSWNALIAEYSKQEHGEDALKCYGWMQREGIPADAVTFTCALKACASVGAANKGKEIHFEIICQGLLESSVALGSALVDMYVKCGAIKEAEKVLDGLHVKNVASWNALITGYNQHSRYEEALICFEQILCKFPSPNAITLTGVLNACSRSGLLNEGHAFWRSMTEIYGIIPCIQHYTCMIDLLGRMGQFGKALSVIRKVISLDDLVVWSSVLSTCQKWGNVKFGEWAFELALKKHMNLDFHGLVANGFGTLELEIH